MWDLWFRWVKKSDIELSQLEHQVLIELGQIPIDRVAGERTIGIRLGGCFDYSREIHQAFCCRLSKLVAIEAGLPDRPFQLAKGCLDSSVKFFSYFTENAHDR